MNSFIPINRLPKKVLSLISTHLPSQNDRFRIAFVCRHWRRSFLQNATLSSHPCFSKGEVYARTIPEGAEASMRSILLASSVGPIGIVMLPPPHAKQIVELEFMNNRWADVRRFSEINSGLLPLLRIITIDIVEGINRNSSNASISPPQPLFSEAVGLKMLRLHSKVPPFLGHFNFPNLLSFTLSVTSAEQFRGSQLLDFLEASPMLKEAYVKILTALSLEGIPRERVVVLRHVKNLDLTASDGGAGYKLATHILCPSVRKASFTHMGEVGPYELPPPGTFPGSDSLNAIIRQYTRSPIEEVRLDITGPDHFIACSLVLRSADMAVINFRFQVDKDSHIPEFFSCDVFSIALRAIWDPLLANIKSLHIYGLDVKDGTAQDISYNFGGFLRFLGPLEELTICHCGMRPWFLYNTDIARCSPVRVLMLTDPWDTLTEDVAQGVVELAKTQHELGVPLERVTIRSRVLVADMEERLRPWVRIVDCAVP